MLQSHLPPSAFPPPPCSIRTLSITLIEMLLFKKKFLEAIRSGEKTQTVRLWKYCRMRPGQRSYIPGAGYIRVTEITEVRIDDLTDEDARPDGFGSADLLRAEISRLYPQQLADGYKAYKIAFRLLPPEEQVKKAISG
jgi:hypothetical protein